MGLYIDVEMPKGELGAIPIMIYADGNVEHFFSHEKYGKAIEVPAPHGRLIDADDMAEDLNFDVENDQRALGQMDFAGEERERIQFDKDCKQNCMWYLFEAPTVIPASEEEVDEAQRDYERAVEDQQYCEMYEPTYDPDTGAM